MTSPKGIILLRQQGYHPIEETSMLAALPVPFLHCPRQSILLNLSEETDFSSANHDWHGAGGQLRDYFWEKVKPILDAHPEYDIAYFGTVPISLAAQCGYLLGTWRKVLVFQHHHVRKDWNWQESAPGRTFQVTVYGLPRDRSQARGDVVVRVSTSHIIDPILTRQVVQNPLGEIDIRTDSIGEDILGTPEELDCVAGKFKEVIDTVHRLYPHVTMIHLFAACPVGLAMLLGKQVGQRIHPHVQTYEFDSKTNPRYTASLILQDDSEPDFVVRESEGLIAESERLLWAEELAKIQTFANGLSQSGSKAWLFDVLPAQGYKFFMGPWQSLPGLASLRSLRKGRIEMAVRQAPGGFRFDRDEGVWILSDEFLLAIHQRLREEPLRRRAARLFFFHEGVHEFQTLTYSTGPEIGRFPKVLEEIDYRADVWAFLHERVFTLHTEPGGEVDHQRFLQANIKIAIEIMMSFDSRRLPLRRMQTRRVSRYLIWSWQYVHLGLLPEDSLQWSILAEKPLVELAGPKILSISERIFFLLDSRYLTSPELGIYHGNRLSRTGQGLAAPIGEIIEALRMLDGERLLNGLRGVVEQTVRLGHEPGRKAWP